LELVIPARDKIYAGEQEKDICLRSLVLSQQHIQHREIIGHLWSSARRPQRCARCAALIKNRLLFIKGKQ
jgi:hypothetical protein